MIRPEDIKTLLRIRSIYGRAEAFARLAHEGQIRRVTREPHFNHCRRVGQAVALVRPTSDVVAAAFLHDVLEDTSETTDTLSDAGFSQNVIRIVSKLTRTKGSDYGQYIHNIRRCDADVRLIKVCDIVDNLADEPSNEQVDKYRNALLRLAFLI